MNPRLRHAMLLLGICACAGCTHLGGIQPVQPAQTFSNEAESTPAEEVPAKPVGSARSASDETSASAPSLFADPALDEPGEKRWPVDSIADTYERPSFKERFRAECGDMLHSIGRDYRNYYSLENFGMLAAGFGVGAILANTDADQDIHNWHAGDIRSHSTDEFGHVVKYFGEGGYEATLMGAAWMMGNMFDDTRFGAVASEWGSRGLRTIVVGAPPMLLMQFVTGASRPNETSAESTWKPFNDANGVSGHAFMGAVPFISAAKMTENVPLKLGFYAFSTFPGWSRVNDGAHYTSQSILGWWMAYCAATAVDITERNGHDWTIMPLPMSDGAGMAITYQY